MTANRLLIALILATMPLTFAFALDLSWTGSNSKRYETSNPKLLPLLKVVRKDGRCSFATARVPRPSWPGKNVDLFQPKSVTCVGDLVLNAGTLRERKGCGIFYLDANTLRVDPIIRDSDFDIVSESCSAGGFEKLMNSELLGNFKAKDAVFYPRSWFSHESIVILSDNQKFTDWFISTKRRDEEDSKKLLEKKKHQGDPPTYSANYDAPPQQVKSVESDDPLLNSGKSK